MAKSDSQLVNGRKKNWNSSFYPMWFTPSCISIPSLVIERGHRITPALFINTSSLSVSFWNLKCIQHLTFIVKSHFEIRVIHVLCHKIPDRLKRCQVAFPTVHVSILRIENDFLAGFFTFFQISTRHVNVSSSFRQIHGRFFAYASIATCLNLYRKNRSEWHPENFNESMVLVINSNLQSAPLSHSFESSS